MSVCVQHLCGLPAGLSSLMNRAPEGPQPPPGCSQTDADWWAPDCKLPVDKRDTKRLEMRRLKKDSAALRSCSVCASVHFPDL